MDVSQFAQAINGTTKNLRGEVTSAVSSIKTTVGSVFGPNVTSPLSKISSSINLITVPGSTEVSNQVNSLLASQAANVAVPGKTSATTTISSKAPVSVASDSFKIKLISATFDATVVFHVSPGAISETNTANYSTIEPIHTPTSYKVFKNTQARTFSFEAKFVSRNAEEAQANIQTIQQLRGWMRPYFGQGTAESIYSEVFGAPPEVLYFYGYTNIGADSNGSPASQRNWTPNYAGIPVVIESLNITYPDSVDYIQTSTGEPLPIIMTASISLGETHSPLEVYEFDIAQFYDGTLVNF
jgi:hypothetical protein